jgi:hypothetical protein
MKSLLNWWQTPKQMRASVALRLDTALVGNGGVGLLFHAEARRRGGAEKVKRREEKRREEKRR